MQIVESIYSQSTSAVLNNSVTNMLVLKVASVSPVSLPPDGTQNCNPEMVRTVYGGSLHDRVQRIAHHCLLLEFPC